MYEYISSRQNRKILDAVALKERKNRKEEGLFFFEGKKLFEEAIKRAAPLVSLFMREDIFPDHKLLSALPSQCTVYRVSEGVYNKLTEEKSPEGLFCISKTIDKYHKFATIYNSPDFLEEMGSELLMAVSLRDPGNLGTLIRTAAAFGVSGLILSEDCADLYNSKTVRAAMGTLFDMPVYITKNPQQTVNNLRCCGFSVYGSALDRKAIPLPSLPDTDKCCFIIGNEGHGLPAELLACCTGSVFIPMTEKAESLNASIAAAILMYSRFKA